MGCKRLILFGFLLSFHEVSGHLSAADHNKEESHVTPSAAPPVSDHRFFLHEIFTKYGHEGQMTFEGFEHLLESLGLGNIIISDHDVAAHKDNPNRNIHDTHEHAKKIDHIDLPTLKGHDSNLTTPSVVATPPAILQKASNRHRHNHILFPAPTKSPETTVEPRNQDSASTSEISPSQSGPSKVQLNDHLYRYQLKESEIPELLVNISTLVDQHQEMDDHTPEIIIEQCLSPREILEAFGIDETSSLNPVSFLHLCPAIIYELDQGHCLFKEHSHTTSKPVSTSDQWLFSSFAVLIISLCGLLSVAVIPIMQKWFYHTLLQFLVGLAVGSLSGDALLHLMPHAMLGGEGSHSHGDPLSLVETERAAIWRGFAALFGIFFFFVAERLLATYASYRKEKKENIGMKVVDLNLDSPATYNGNVGEKLSQYRNSSFNINPNEKEMVRMFQVGGTRKLSCDSLHSLEMNCDGAKTFSSESCGSVTYKPEPSQAPVVNNGHGHSHHHSHEVPDSISAVALMVIMGDGLHNFCDGLAIGAAFASGIEGGISTAVAVFCHELPHELGDFAMLLKTGMKVKEALFYNGLSSVLCFIGMGIGISLGNVHSATSWVFAATAGMFLYIALVDMLPELNASGDSNTQPSQLLAIQLLGICSGVSIMLLIANYEQDLKNIIS
ncbi:zinc transporter ZIP10 [Parasteatoda tepidariorum]|uniref:zinc transporter ZIP10 n=1 Tax=Parasteatoda tepidariorum TaxID=114398 RepID=UPI00077FD659|nr:zinc transporter ZIP10 [Parasteatoda tepidariorum]XP_015917729.1 zinc transporter ZIP10 [Parasteatoda tepidariorum]XP_015917730.1 zinc transporter ZIP10 [Parasteatoda tepidariorum]